MVDENQRKGKLHIKDINSVAFNIYKQSNYNKNWTDCLVEAMDVHRNFIIYLEERSRIKQEQQYSVL